MARFALLPLAVSVLLLGPLSLTSAESTAPDGVLFDRRRSEQPRLEARSQHGTSSASYTSDTSTYQPAQHYIPVNDQLTASGGGKYTRGKTFEPVSTTTDWTSAAGSYSSAGAGGATSTFSGYESSSMSVMSPAASSSAAAASPPSVDIVVLQLAVVLEVRSSFARARSRSTSVD